MKENWKVLLIDDDNGIRRVTAIALEDAGYTVYTAPDGETGIRIFEEQSPHIVITDIEMPGIDGLEVLRRIKEIDPDKEVIISTGFSEIALAIRAMQLDASGFVTKPVSDEALAVALNRAKERYSKRKNMMDYTTLLEERWMDTADELAKTFHFQKMLIESSIDGIAACNKRGRIVVFNRSMENMLGYSRADVLGKMSLLQFFAPGQAARFHEALYSSDEGGELRLFPFKTRMMHRDGVEVPVLLSATVLLYEAEEIGIVTFIRSCGSPDILLQRS